MTTSNLSVIQIAATTDYWKKISDTAYLAVIEASSKEYLVEVSDLNDIHPLLPFAIDNVLDHRMSVEPDKPTIWSILVELNAQVLKHGYIEVKDTTNTTPWAFVELSGMRENTLNKDELRVSGTTVDVKNVSHGDIKVPCIVDEGWNEIIVSKNEMTASFPGWEERWRIGLEIGLDDHALLPHVFRVNNVPPQTLDISFE